MNNTNNISTSIPDTFSQEKYGSCIVCGQPVRLLYKDIFDDRHGYPELYSITRCDHCGFCRTDPALRRKELTSIYRKYYPRSTETPEGVLRTFEALKKISPLSLWIQGRGVACYRYISLGSKVLDLGCGNCLSLLMARHYGASQVTGVEVDTNILPIAKKLNLDVHIGQLSDLPAKNGNFDFIMANQVLEHEPSPRKLLLEMSQRLADNGRIILSFPNVGAFYRHIFKRRWLHWHPPYHINHFSRKSITMLAEQCGLTIKIQTITPNAWMTYQIRTIRKNPKLGQRDTFWDPCPTPLPITRLPWKALPGKVFNVLYPIGLRPVLCLVNRLLDSIGLGEAFVVSLMK